jgi:hypothetical protein
MVYKLNDFNQNVTDEELLEDLKKTAESVGDIYLSIERYKTVGKYSDSTFRSHFGSWFNALSKVGLRTERNNKEMQRISDKMLIVDLIAVSKKLDKNRITSTEYTNNGEYSLPTIIIRFNTWSKFVEEAALEQTGFIKKIDDINLFSEIERIWTILGKQPTTTDMKKSISNISLDTFSRRFGGWRNTLIAFLEYINHPETEAHNEIPKENEIIEKYKNNISKLKRTPRDVNLRLRFRILQRDSFKCCFCGSSPAQDQNIILHVDHILPWSKGGETILENLQTLCSKCNYGKSNL